MTCRLWRTEERAHRSAIKLQFSGHHFEIISHRILIILKHGFLQKCLNTIGIRKHCDADLDNCLRVASLGRLGAMLGKLPSLVTRSKVRIHQTWWLCASTVPPDPLVVDGVEGGLATKRGVSADGAGVVLGHLTIGSIINCAEFKSSEKNTNMG